MRGRPLVPVRRLRLRPQGRAFAALGRKRLSRAENLHLGGEVAGFACAAAKTRSALHSIAPSSGHRGDSDPHPPLVNWRWPGGRVASHIYLVGKSTSQKTAFGEFAVAGWPGGQSLLSSRKSRSRRRACTTISFAFHFAILCSGHRGHSGHRFFLGLKSTITCGDRSASNIRQKASAEEFAAQT